MSNFSSRCQSTVLNKKDAAPITPVIKSTYQTDYISPKIQIRDELKTLVETALPPDYLAIDSGKRILPITFRDVFRNCISASIGERLELKFTDDTPDWKYYGRAAADRYWQQDYRFKNYKPKTNKPLRRKKSKLESILSDITKEIPDKPFLCNYYYDFCKI